MDNYCRDVYPLPLYMHNPHGRPTIRSIPLVSQADSLIVHPISLHLTDILVLPAYPAAQSAVVRVPAVLIPVLPVCDD